MCHINTYCKISIPRDGGIQNSDKPKLNRRGSVQIDSSNSPSIVTYPEDTNITLMHLEDPAEGMDYAWDSTINEDEELNSTFQKDHQRFC